MGFFFFINNDEPTVSEAVLQIYFYGTSWKNNHMSMQKISNAN